MTLAVEQQLTVPNIIHFIWAGGDKPLPKYDDLKEKSNHHIIQEWQIQNPQFITVLWVDLKTLSSRNKQEYLNRNYQWIDSLDEVISAPDQFMRKNQLCVTGIDQVLNKISHYFTEEETVFLKDIINYEMNSFYPNYGSSSDLLRYLILFIYGGAYFDSDVHPGYTPLGKHYAFKKNNNFSGFNVIEDESNDAFICLPEHQFLHKILKKSLSNYKNQHPEKINTWSYRWLTLYRTGPMLVFEFVPLISRYLLSKDFIFQKDRIGNKSWIHHTTYPLPSLKTALNRAVKSMYVEMKHMNICRFSDHVKDISRSLRENILQFFRFIQINSSPWGTFLTELTKRYESELQSLNIQSSVLPKFEQLDSANFHQAFKQYISNETHQGESEENFDLICNDLKIFLENNGVDQKIVQRVLAKIDDRYPSAKFYRKKNKLELLQFLGAFTPVLGDLFLNNLLLEENLLFILFPKNLDNQSLKTLLDANVLNSLVVNYNHLLQEIMSWEHPFPHSSLDVAEFSLKDIQDILNFIDSADTLQWISQCLVGKLQEIKNINELLKTSLHHKDDQQYSTWSTFFEENKIISSVPSPQHLETIQDSTNIYLDHDRTLDHVIDIFKKVSKFCANKFEDSFKSSENPKLRNQFLIHDFINELPKLIKENEEHFGYLYLGLNPQAKIGAILFIISLQLTGETILESF